MNFPWQVTIPAGLSKSFMLKARKRFYVLQPKKIKATRLKMIKDPMFFLQTDLSGNHLYLDDLSLIEDCVNAFKYRHILFPMIHVNFQQLDFGIIIEKVFY